jgi:threonine/homoserine/homoserine lactone efflux protein
MLDPQSYAVFLATAVVLVLSPGPDTILVLSRALASGTRAGLTTLVGTQLGNVVHAVLAGVGVSTVILLFPVAYKALKVVGIAYLLYLAVTAWRAPGTLDVAVPSAGRSPGAGRYLLQGLANNLANPKMIAFFLALFPQFVHPEAGSLVLQSFVLGSTLALMALAWIGLLVVAVGRFRALLATSGTFLKLANRLAAVTFAGLACRLALEESR